VDPSGHKPHVIFVGGFNTDDSSDDGSQWKTLASNLHLDRSDWEYFNWGAANQFGIKASIWQNVNDAVITLDRQIRIASEVPGQQIILIGHSKGGELVAEYASRVAEGNLQAQTSVAGAFTLSSPLGRGPEESTTGYQRLNSCGVDRLAGINDRLVSRGATFGLHILQNPFDVVSAFTPGTTPSITSEYGGGGPGDCTASPALPQTRREAG
jgi:pimeloyl-ACP methyl ester carboxylesterase